MNDFKIIFLSTALTDEIFKEIVNNCKSFSPTFSGVGFDRNIGEGLSQNAEVTGVSLYPIPSYPKYSRIIQKENSFVYNSFRATAAALINLPVVKEFSYSRFVKKYIKKTVKKDEKTAVVVCGMYRTLLRPARWIKKRYSSAVCTVVPDLPDLMSLYRRDYSGIRKLVNKLDVRAGKNIRSCSDGYVFLSRHMNPLVNAEGKEYIVIDGMCADVKLNKSLKYNGKPFVMYAGKISKTFGVDKLISAFLNSGIDGYELKLFGDGDYADEVRKIAEKEERICYGGVVPHEIILQNEQLATLLVEPRPSDTEIAKMSFPSKIIEYMMSGTPVLSTNLPCYSDEYLRYQYRIDDESVQGFTEALKKVLSFDPAALAAKGIEARGFILENKTVAVQCKKISDFAERLVNDKNRE